MTSIDPFAVVPLTDEQQHGTVGTIVHALVEWLHETSIVTDDDLPLWADDIRTLGTEIAEQIEADLGM